MKVKFSIVDLNLDFTEILKDEKKWWFNNTHPKIPENTSIENLSDEQKISLIQLAIYEMYIDTEYLCNLPKNHYKIHSK